MAVLPRPLGSALTPPSTRLGSPDPALAGGLLQEAARALSDSRYFRHMPRPVLMRTLSAGRIRSLEAGEILIREGDTSCRDMYVLLSGSLAVESAGRYILRLDRAGDIIGELAVLQPTPRAADVIAESTSQLLAFSPDILRVDEGAETAPIFYVMLAHILATKLKLTTAQSLLRKNERTGGGEQPRVALVDSCEPDRALLRSLLAQEWPQAAVVEYADPTQFVGSVEPRGFALCIVDVEYAHPSGASAASSVLMEALRAQGGLACIVSKVCADGASRASLLALGASDCLPKPIAQAELKHVLHRGREWFYKNRELDRIERQADTDALTGLANRRRLDEFLGALQTTFEEHRQPFSLIICDVDHFKHYNDRNGHPQGDAVLARVAHILQARVRRGDLAARFGGEEFVVVLPNCPLDRAIGIAEDLRKAIEQEPFAHAGDQPLGRVSATFGVASYVSGDVASLLQQADTCLYRGKAQGRNIVVAAEQGPVP